MTDSTNSVTRMRRSTEERVKSTLAASFSLLSFLKASSSLASLTKALMTEMPEKLSWEKSLSLEKASWRISHFLLIYCPTTALEASNSAMGIMEKTVISGFMFHILMTASTPRNSASKNMRMPEP